MGRPEVYIEHTQGEKRRRQMRVDKKDMFLIGSSPEADLRLGGENVNGCHAVLQFRGGDWYLCDLVGNGETRIGGQSITEHRLQGMVEVQVGKHRLKLFSRERRDTLFTQSLPEGDRGLHQVVVRLKGRVIETKVLKATESFKYSTGTEKHVLSAPTSGEWVVTELGKRTIQQRLVASQALIDAAPIEIDRGLRKPALVTLALFLLLISVAIVLPKKETTVVQEAVIPKQQLEMIVNAKVIKKKRAEVTKMTGSKVKAGGTSEAAAPAQTRTTPEESTGPKISAKATQALTSLRQSGLSALVGKIAKRANKQGIMVATNGVSADNASAGRAFYSTGTTTTGGGGAPSKEGSTYRLGGVGTKGKGGGAGDFKAGTALAGGNVGMGDVGVVDEETVIEGGLDRDVIAEVIKRNLGQIRYCYERQLSSNRDLYGKVMVRFNIGADGGVGDPKIDNSTMKNAMVEGCIMRRVASWKFPLPKGGTTVKVSYPFLFKALD